jgi:hypothetical protein
VDVVVYDDRDNRYVPLLVALGSAALTAAIVGGLTYELGRSQPAESQPLSSVSEPQAGGAAAPSGATIDPTCASSVERADAAVAIGERLERSLAEQTSLVDELLAGRATSEQVLDQALPPLTASAKDRQAFLQAVTAYRQAQDECRQ